MGLLWLANRRRSDRAAVMARVTARAAEPKSMAYWKRAPYGELCARIAVLRDKADRVQRFIDDGDVAHLDDKQLAILADGTRRFPEGYFTTLRRTIDVLESRRSYLERRRRQRRRVA